MRPRRNNNPVAPRHINVTPMIDVVMVLIIFFLMVGHLAAERRAKIDLPEASLVDQPDTEPVTVSLDASRGLSVDGRAVTPAGLSAALVSANASDRGVRLRADRDLSYARIGPVLAACRDAGSPRIELAVTRSGGAAP